MLQPIHSHIDISHFHKRTKAVQELLLFQNQRVLLYSSGREWSSQKMPHPGENKESSFTKKECKKRFPAVVWSSFFCRNALDFELRAWSGTFPNLAHAPSLLRSPHRRSTLRRAWPNALRWTKLVKEPDIPAVGCAQQVGLIGPVMGSV